MLLLLVCSLLFLPPSPPHLASPPTPPPTPPLTPPLTPPRSCAPLCSLLVTTPSARRGETGSAQLSLTPHSVASTAINRTILSTHGVLAHSVLIVEKAKWIVTDIPHLVLTHITYMKSVRGTSAESLTVSESFFKTKKTEIRVFFGSRSGRPQIYFSVDNVNEFF